MKFDKMRIQVKTGQLEVFALVLMTAGLGLFFVIHTMDEGSVGHGFTGGD